MRDIKGFICVASLNPQSRVMFGRNTDSDRTANYGNFEDNGFVPFEISLEAALARNDLQKRSDLSNIYIAQVEMQLAESVTESESLKGQANLVVVARVDGATLLIGKRVEGKPHIGHIPGTRIVDNGFKPCKNFTSALEIWREWNRQGQSGAVLATFRIKLCE